MPFFMICPCCEPSMAGAFRALCFVTTPWTWQGTDVFLGSNYWTRGYKEKPMVIVPLLIQFFFHWPWTWWVPGCRSIKDPHLKLLKTRMQSLKRGWSRSGWCPCKKRFTILRWWGVFSWQGPFNGCHYANLTIFADMKRISQLFSNIKIAGK